MRDVVVDVRCLQDPVDLHGAPGRHAAGLLRPIRACPGLASHRLIGLFDPALPALPGWVPPLLDGLRTTAYTGALHRPACLVQLSPMTQDPLFVARLLHHPAVPAATVVPEALNPPDGSAEARLDWHVALRWLARHQLFLPVSERAAARLRALLPGAETVVAADAAPFWAAIAARLRPGVAPATPVAARPRLALLTPLPPDQGAAAGQALCAALGAVAELHVFTPTVAPDPVAGAASVRPLGPLPLLSSRFDRVIGIVANAPQHAGILELLLRFGGACIAHDRCLLELYHDQLGATRAVRLAEAELGRPLELHEVWHWLDGSLPVAPLFLGELAAAAEPLLLRSADAVAAVARRYGRTALHLPGAVQPVPAATPARRQAARARLGVPADALLIVSLGCDAAEDAIWALELLHAWGIPARLHFVGRGPDDPAPTQHLCGRLDLTNAVAFPGWHTRGDHLLAADIGLQLRPHGRVAAIDAGAAEAAVACWAAAGVPAVASATLADSADAPAGIRRIADHPSPVLVAEAIADLLAAPPCIEPGRSVYVGQHAWRAYADRLRGALQLDR